MCWEVALMAAGMAVQTVGSMRDANAASAAARANQRVADQQAQVERDVGQVREAQLRREQRRFRSEQIVAGSAQGTALTGQFVDILAEDARVAAFDRALLRHDTEVRASGFETAGAFSAFEGQQARDSGFLRAGTALLTGGSRIASRFGGGGSTSGNRIRTVTPPLPQRASR